MRTYTSIILLALVSSSLAIFSTQSPTAQTSKISGELVSIQTEQQGDKAPHRGSGRRQFFQSQNYEDPNI